MSAGYGYGLQTEKSGSSERRLMGIHVVCGSLTLMIGLRFVAILLGGLIQVLYGFNGAWSWPTWLGIGYEGMCFLIYCALFVGLMVVKDARESILDAVPSPLIDSHDTSLIMSATLTPILLGIFGIIIWSIFTRFTVSDTLDGQYAGTFKDTDGGVTPPYANLSARGINAFQVAFNYSMASWMISTAVTTIALLYYYTSHPPQKLWDRINKMRGKPVV